MSFPKAYIVQHASTIRYRKSLDFLMQFSVVTKLVYFDERSMYFEQKFVSHPDGFVRAVAFCKNTAVNVHIPTAMMKFNVYTSPPCPPELQKFMECHEISSNNLKMKGFNGTVASNLSALSS